MMKILLALICPILMTDGIFSSILKGNATRVQSNSAFKHNSTEEVKDLDLKESVRSSQRERYSRDIIDRIVSLSSKEAVVKTEDFHHYEYPTELLNDHLHKKTLEVLIDPMQEKTFLNAGFSTTVTYMNNKDHQNLYSVSSKMLTTEDPVTTAEGFTNIKIHGKNTNNSSDIIVLENDFHINSTTQVSEYIISESKYNATEINTSSVSSSSSTHSLSKLNNATEGRQSVPVSQCFTSYEASYFKLQRMNTSIKSVLEVYGSHYTHFYNIYDSDIKDLVITYWKHAEECQMFQNSLIYHFNDVERNIPYFNSCNLSTNVTEQLEYVKFEAARMYNLCQIYKDTKEIVISWANVQDRIANESLFLYNESLFVHDVYNGRELLRNYEDLMKVVDMFILRKHRLENYIISTNLTSLINESTMLNYIENQIFAIESLLQNYADFKVKVDVVNGTDINIFLRIRLPLYSIVLITGIIGNAVLLFIFAKKKEMRTSANILIFNLVLADTLNLTTNIISIFVLELNSFYPFVNYGECACRVITGFEFLSIGLSAWTVPALGIQRFTIIMSAKHASNRLACITNKRLGIVFLGSVWIIAIYLSLLIALDASISLRGLCSYRSTSNDILLRLIVYGILPLVIVMVSFIPAAQRLVESARNMPGEAQGQLQQQNARFKGARVLIALSFVYAFSYVPYFLYASLFDWGIVERTTVNEYIIAFLFFLLFVNSAVNPFALCISSTAFRKHFNAYLFKCCKIKANIPHQIPLAAIIDTTTTNPNTIPTLSTEI